MTRGRTTGCGANSLRLALFLFLTATCFGQMQLWKYVPPDPAALVVMEWRRVLDSPSREMFRREIPAGALQLLGGVNFIEGIERAVVSGTGDSALILLGGNFDSAALREAAVADGGIVKMYREAQILQPADPDQQAENLIALIGRNVVLIGKKDIVLATLDAAQLVKLQPRGTGYDLWIYSASPGPDVASSEFGMLHLKDGGIRVDSMLRLRTPAAAVQAVRNAQTADLTVRQSGNDVQATGSFTPDLFSRRLGEWRTTLNQVAVAVQKPEPVPTGPQKVRIYGLDGGPKEVTFPPATPPER